MLGLRSHGRFAGATRLLDEWLMGLEPFWAKGPRTIDDPVAVEIVGAAAARVRKFARRGGVLEPVLPDGAGILRFELQGYDYLARARCFAPASIEDVAHVETKLREGLGALLGALSGEEQAVFALVVAPEGDGAVEAQAWADALTALPSSGIAWAFPDERDPFGQRGVTEERPGAALLLAWSGDPTWNPGAPT